VSSRSCMRIIVRASPSRSFVTFAVVYAGLSLVSSIGAYTTREYVPTGSSQEASRAEITAARKDGKAEEFSELIESLNQQVNEFRAAQGLPPLRLEPIISAQARQHSLEMACQGNAISHAGFEDRLKKIGEKLSFRAGAENIATSIGDENPARTAVEGWKASPGHRKNLLGDITLRASVSRNASKAAISSHKSSSNRYTKPHRGSHRGAFTLYRFRKTSRASRRCRGP
jgi:uncharacterized protein YkwD